MFASVAGQMSAGLGAFPVLPIATLRQRTGVEAAILIYGAGKLRKEDEMRILLNIRIPHEPFNTAVRQGKASEILKRIVDEAKPEAVYFTEQNGTRSCIMVVNINEPSEIPAFAEPWFLNFNADCEFRVVMTPTDLEKSSLDHVADKWR